MSSIVSSSNRRRHSSFTTHLIDSESSHHHHDNLGLGRCRLLSNYSNTTTLSLNAPPHSSNHGKQLLGRLSADDSDHLLLSTEHDYDCTPPTRTPPPSNANIAASRTRRLSTAQLSDKSRAAARNSSLTTRPSISSSTTSLHSSSSIIYSSNRTSSTTTLLRPSSPSITPSPSAARARTRTSSSSLHRTRQQPSLIPNPSNLLHSPPPRASLSSRPSTPNTRRPHPPDFPLDTPPNLITTLPHNRAVSAARSRPAAPTLKETQAPASASRRQPSPIVNRWGRSLTEPTAKGRHHASSNDLAAQRSLKASTTATLVTDGNGFGRTISKKSLDMAIRHNRDIRNSSPSLGSLPSPTLFPQSIPTSTPKTQLTRGLSTAPVHMMNGRQYNFAKFSEVDIYKSSRYDAMLLKIEDLKNSEWLHSADGKCDQGPIFDNGFESLPEPFAFL